MKITRKNRKHSLSEKLQVVELYKLGYGYRSISKKLQLSDSLVKRWLRAYNAHGVVGLERSGRRCLNPSLKTSCKRRIRKIAIFRVGSP